MAYDQLDIEAFLFDMDGTLVDSIRAVERTYIDFCNANAIEATGHPHVRNELLDLSDCPNEHLSFFREFERVTR